jgi:hypothetical protein
VPPSPRLLDAISTPEAPARTRPLRRPADVAFEFSRHQVTYFTDPTSPDFDHESDTQFRLELTDNPTPFGTADALTSDALPATLDLAKFAQGGQGYAIHAGGGAVYYNITRIVVPEPGGASLLVLGAAALCCAAKRPRR